MKQERKSKQQWERIISDFINSGESKKDYCEQKGIKQASLRRWYYRLHHKIYKQAADEINGKGVENWLVSKGEGKQSAYGTTGDFIRLRVRGSKEVGEQELWDKDKQDSMNQSAKTGTVKITLRNGIKLEVVTGNLLDLIKELNYVA